MGYFQTFGILDRILKVVYLVCRYDLLEFVSFFSQEEFGWCFIPLRLNAIP